jgi:hypothetical protein
MSNLRVVAWLAWLTICAWLTRNILDFKQQSSKEAIS